MKVKVWRRRKLKGRGKGVELKSLIYSLVLEKKRVNLREYEFFDRYEKLVMGVLSEMKKEGMIDYKVDEKSAIVWLTSPKTIKKVEI